MSYHPFVLDMVFDTETTGKGDFKAAYDHPSQPLIVQLGYKVFERSSREVVFEVGHLVDSTNLKDWNGIEPGAQAVHGISEELIKAYGSSPEATLKNFTKWANLCTTFWAHNKQFDIRIMQRFAKAAGWSPNLFGDGEGKGQHCTMNKLTPICKLPHPQGWNSFKWPSLAEGYTFCTGKEMSGAHNALVDVNACADIMWWLYDKGHHNFEVV